MEFITAVTEFGISNMIFIFMSSIIGVLIVLFVKDRSRKEELLRVLNEAEMDNNHFLEMAENKMLKGAAEEIKKLFK
jgi:hypothetical protein